MVLFLVGQAKNSSECYWHSAGTLTLILRVSVGIDVNLLSMALGLSPDFAYSSELFVLSKLPYFFELL